MYGCCVCLSCERERRRINEGEQTTQKKLLKNVIRIVFADGHAFFSPAERSLGVGFVSVSSFPIPARPTDSRDVVYTTCPQLESSSRLTSRQVASFQKSFQNIPIEQYLPRIDSDFLPNGSERWRRWWKHQVGQETWTGDGSLVQAEFQNGQRIDSG